MSAVLLCHEATKQGMLFFKAFCLLCEKIGRPIPEPNFSVMMACLDQVCLRKGKGRKCKAEDIIEQMKDYREKVFCKIFPEKVDMSGKSHLKRHVADQMLLG